MRPGYAGGVLIGIPHMTDNPTFSVIVPTYNRQSSVHACLQSLAQQNYPAAGFEVVVVDDGSSPPVRDTSRAEIRKMNLILLRSPQNEGPAAARNRGASCARGRYLAFTDDDCRPDANWLAGLESALAVAPASAAGGHMIDGGGDLFSAASHSILEASYDHYNETGGTPRFFASLNLAVPTKEFREVGGFLPEFRTSEDREFCARWLRHGHSLVFAPDAVVVHKSPDGLRPFLRRHYHYGKGAYRFRTLQAKYRKRRMELEPSVFYWQLIRHPLAKHAGMRGVGISFLVAVSQIASFLGFLAERRHAKRAHGASALRTPPAAGGWMGTD